MSLLEDPNLIRSEGDSADDSPPPGLAQIRRRARCHDCGRGCMAREALGSVALGYKDAPRCLPCSALRLGRTDGELCADLVQYARRRDYYALASAEAERLDRLRVAHAFQPGGRTVN